VYYVESVYVAAIRIRNLNKLYIPALKAKEAERVAYTAYCM